jgi:N-acetyl-alpha-D-muramate 1-phosphate uridylyltransferase
MQISRAMVFAAGLGTRLKPLTLHTPKPLVKVGGAAMLDHTVARFAEAGVRQIVINTHHLAEQVEAHVRSHYAALDVTLSHEDPVLETGGGIVKVLSYFENAPFFSANSDTIWLDRDTPALQRLASAFDPERMDALLLLHPLERAIGYQGPGNFALADDGVLVRSPSAPFVFTGLQILHPRLFQGRKAEPFSLRELYLAAEGKDGRLSRMHGLVHTGDWVHVGTPEELAEANAFFAKRESSP